MADKKENKIKVYAGTYTDYVVARNKNMAMKAAGVEGFATEEPYCTLVAYVESKEKAQELIDKASKAGFDVYM